MKKTYTLLSLICIYVLTATGVSFFPAVANDKNINTLTDDTPFDCDDCVNGECGAWTNGCICWRDQLNLSGKNCDEASKASCQKNADCPQNTYCNIDKNAKPCAVDLTMGNCFNRTHYSPVTIKGKTFVLSRPLMNWYSAQNFCAALGADWIPAVRTDLDCSGLGIGCVDKFYVGAFQNKTGFRGFLWLGEKTQDCKGYYIDLNDGAIYTTRLNALNTAQALCVQM